jgi:hypothetical protein
MDTAVGGKGGGRGMAHRRRGQGRGGDSHPLCLVIRKGRRGKGRRRETTYMTYRRKCTHRRMKKEMKESKEW